MNQPETIATWEILRGLGFELDKSVFSDINPGLSFDFGNFKLSASFLRNMRLKEVAFFTGVLSTERTIAEVDFEMPLRFKSREQCEAWIVWNLDQCAPHRVFIPMREVGWIAEGRENFVLLPWEEDKAAFEARPHCSVQHEWLRLVLKTLALHLSRVDDKEQVLIGFDGSVLLFRCAGKVVVMPAEGLKWSTLFTISAGRLRNLPRRFVQDLIDVSIWNGMLRIGQKGYMGVSAAESNGGNEAIGAQ
jgi:hypothetical protein